MKKILLRTLLVLGVIILLCIAYFFTIRKLDSNLYEAGPQKVDEFASGKPVLLPSQFIEAARFYIKVPAKSGDTLLAYADSGGGISMVPPWTAEDPAFAPHLKTALAKGVMPLQYLLFSDISNAVPGPAPLRDKVLRDPFSAIKEPYVVMPPDSEMGEIEAVRQTMEFDLFLGQNFFMGRSWTLDYPQEQIWVNTPVSPGDKGKPGVLPLGFKQNSAGATVFGHPSMTIEVDGEAIDVLFDTGATIVLSESGKKGLGTNDKTVAGSFISKSVFQKWRKKHPDWKYYKAADREMDIIEVPSVTIAGQQTGPVLFAERPDEVWSEWMISSMDKVVKGAIGGSALQYFRVTIDYDSQLARFKKAAPDTRIPSQF